MAAGKKSIIRRWETQVGIGVAVACFAVLGVFLGLKITDGKSDRVKEVAKVEKVSFVEAAPMVKETSATEIVLRVEKQASDVPALGGPGDKVSGSPSAADYEENEPFGPEDALVRAGDGKTGAAPEEPSTVVGYLTRGLPGEVLEEPPVIKSSSEDMIAVKGPVVAGDTTAAGDATGEKVVGTYPRVHKVRPSDTLMDISKEHYGTVSRWKLIYDANGLSNKDILLVGQELSIPAPSETVERQPMVKKASFSGRRSSPGIAYRVQQGDTLQKLAGVYYNDESGWKRIYNANKGSLKGRKTLEPGEVLIIP